MSEVARLRASLQLDSRLKGGLSSAKTELTSWVRGTKGWSKPISDEARKAGQNISAELRAELREKASRMAYDAGQQIGESLRNGLSRAGTALTIGVTLPLIALGKASITAASDLEESTSKMAVTFGAAKSKVEEFAKTSAEAYGLSTKAAYDYTSTFGGILRETKLASSATATMSLNLVRLGGDIASFKNLKPEEALEKLRAGLTGEYEPLKSLGYVLNENIVKLKATQLGYKGTADALSESQKMLARYAIIMEKTRDSQGDFARTQGGVANQTRILKAEMENQLALFGRELLPLTKDAIKVGRDLVGMFKDLSAEQRQQLLKYALLAAALGPVIKLTMGLASAIGSIIKLRAAYVTAQAAMTAANAGTAASANAATGALVATRVAVLGLIALAAVPIIITVKAVYDFKDAADRALSSTQKAAAQGFTMGDFIRMQRQRGSKKTNTQLIEDFKRSRYYKPFMDSVPNHDRNEQAYQAREAAKKSAAAEQKKFEESLRNAFNGGLSGNIGKGGKGGGGSAGAIREVAKEYDYWGRIVKKVAEDGFAPLRVSLDQLAASSNGASSPLGGLIGHIHDLLQDGDMAGARALVTRYVDQLKTEPAEIGGIVSSIIDALGDGNEEFKAKVAVSLGDARNLSGSAKALLLDVAKMKDASRAAAEVEKARADTLSEFKSKVSALNLEYQRLNATERQSTALMELQNSDVWPKLTAWQRLSLMFLTQRNAELTKQKEADRERISQAAQLGTIFQNEISQLRERIVLFGQESEMAKLQYRLREGDLQNVTGLSRAYLIYTQKILDAKTAKASLISKMKEWIAVKNADGRSRYSEYIGELTERLLELRGAYDQLLRAQLAKQITTLDPKEKQKQIDAIIELKKSVEGAEELYGYLDRFATGASALFANLFTDIGKGFDTMAGNLLSGLRDLLNEIALEILRSQAKKFIMDLLVKAFDHKAMGGPVSAGRPYIVGERGPEMFVPSGNGNIVPNSQLVGAGAGMALTVNITVNAADANSFRKSQMQIASETALAIQRATSRDYGRTRK